MELGIPDALGEEFEISTELFSGSEPDRIDPVLDRDMASGGKVGDPVSEQFDELTELVRRQSSIDPSVPFRQVGVVILCA